MDRGSDSSKRQNCLEGERMRPNSPLGDPWTLMIMMMMMMDTPVTNNGIKSLVLVYAHP